eukprot:gene14831-5948_t
MVSANSQISQPTDNMAKGIATHATIDKNDGCQDTITGAGTTHDTNRTLFQPVLASWKPPQLFPNHEDDDEFDLLELCLKRDVMWALLDGLPGQGEETDLIGSWTVFNRAVTELYTRKSLLEYMPVIPEPPEYPVCKAFLDKLLDLMKKLEIGNVFAYADEQVYARLAHILWKYPEVYSPRLAEFTS